MTTIDPVWAGIALLSRAFGARTLSPVYAVDSLADAGAGPADPHGPSQGVCPPSTSCNRHKLQPRPRGYCQPMTW